MHCENRGPRHGVHKDGQVKHEIYTCNEASIGFCTLQETGLTSGGKPFAVCSAECPFYRERLVPAFYRVDVVITSHNYGQFLNEALDSVNLQKIVGQVIVVDDASGPDDQTKDICEARGIRYIRTEFKSPHLARGAGFAECTSSLVWFLDADNKGREGYLLEAAKLFAENPRLAIVYPDLSMFGAKSELRPMPDEFDAKRFEQLNFIDTGSVWLAEAVRQQFAFGSDPAGLEDWRLARAVMRSGKWEAAKNPIPLDYRQHDENRLTSGVYGKSYFDRAGLADECVTIFTTFSGRVQGDLSLWEKRKAWLRSQTWPRIRLVVANTSHSELPGGWDRDLPKMEGLSVYSHPVGFPGLEDRDRWGQEKTENAVSTAVASIYNRMWQETQTEFVLVLEDDVFPKRLDAVEQLLKGFDVNVCSVTGKYRQRYYPYALTYWSKESGDVHPSLPHQAPDSGIADTKGSGFGCVMLRRSQMADEVIVANSPISRYYDAHLFAMMARKGLISRVSYGVDCDHDGPHMSPPPMPADRLTVVLTTTCRQSFFTAFASVVSQMGPHDDLLLVVDGKASHAVKRAFWKSSPKGRLIEIENGPHNDWGHTPRNQILPTITDGYVVNLDDDDGIPEGGLDKVRQAIREGVGDLLLFQMRRDDGSLIPNGERLELGNVGTPMLVFPAGIKLGTFAPVYGGDFDFIRDTIQGNPDRSVRWVSEVIIDIRPKPKPKPVKSDWPIGDHVESALSSVGITKERVSRWLGAPCNCPARQAKLNKLGHWAAGFAKGLLGRSEAENMLA